MTAPPASDAGIPRLVLASTSPVRARLLAAAGLQPTTVPPQVDEADVRDSLRAGGAGPVQVADALAELKALKISRADPAAIVIGADQVLTCDGTWFDKPQDSAAARRQLLDLRGRTHALTSALVAARAGTAVWRHAESARLTMRDFSTGFLDGYLARLGDAALGSVGAYQLESLGIQLFDRIDGDFFCILGLPLLPLLAFLREHGVVPA